MKTMLALFTLTLALVALPQIAKADGCFLCSGGGYVQYTGDDTFDKRKAAKEQFGCEVSGTTSSCSGAKGTVSLTRDLINQRVAQN